MSNPKILLTEDDVPGAKIVSSDLNVCTKVQLRRWLECRDMPRGGKKSELIQRIQYCIQNNRSHIISPAVDKGVWLQKKIQISEANLPAPSTGISTVDPPPVSTSWKPFPSEAIPRGYCYGTIYAYMVSGDGELSSDDDAGGTSGGVSGHTKPLSRGRISFTSGSVQDMHSCSYKNVRFIKSRVMSSYGSEFYQVCIGLFPDGNIAYATCITCKASASNRCSHICALLFAIEDYTLHFGFDPVPCTSKLKTWNQGRKKKHDPKPVTDSVYKNPTGEESVSTKRMLEFDPRPSALQDSTFNKQDFVYECQRLKKKTMWETIITYDYEDYAPTSCRLNILKELGTICLAHLTPQSEFCVREVCVGQRSDEWSRERRVRITASECKGFLTKSVSSLERLINEKLWKPSKSLLTVPAVKHGIDSEDTALEGYALMLPQSYQLSKVGFFVNQKYPFLGCSPDGVVQQNGNVVGIVEVKCPFALHVNQLGPLELNKLDKSAIANQCFTIINDNQIKLKRNHSYYFQVQLQMLVMEVEWCDFVVWSRGKVAMEKIGVDKSLCTYLVRTLGGVYRKYLLPELFEMRLPRRLSLLELE